VTIREARDILGVTSGTNEEAIRRAYRERVLKAHPDHGGSTAKFIRIRAAYEILLDCLQVPVDEEDVSVPDELREIIDRMLRDFRRQEERSRERADQALRSFNAKITNEIDAVDRKELPRFDEYFRLEWNELLRQLFGSINADCQRLLGPYDAWLHRNTDAVIAADHERKIRRVRLLRKVLRTVLVLEALLVLVLVGVTGLRSGADTDFFMRVIFALVLSLFGFLAIRLVTTVSTVPTRPSAFKGMKPLPITPFCIGTEHDFKGDNGVRGEQERNDGVLVSLGLAGAAVTSLFTVGIAGPLAAGLAVVASGSAVAAVPEGINRLMKPTGKVKRQLAGEVQAFIEDNRAPILEVIAQGHQHLLGGVEDRMIRQYQSRVRSTVLLLKDHN